MCATPMQAEQAFYDAFNNRNLQQMMSVWSDAHDTTCIHPGGLRLQGGEQIRESWQAIFSTEQDIQLQIDSEISYEDQSLSVRQVIETIIVAGELQGTVLATNVYVRIDQQWKMASHHASVEPPKPAMRTDLH